MIRRGFAQDDKSPAASPSPQKSPQKSWQRRTQPEVNHAPPSHKQNGGVDLDGLEEKVRTTLDCDQGPEMETEVEGTSKRPQMPVRECEW